MERAIAEAARIAGAVLDVDEPGGAEQSSTGIPGKDESRPPRPQGLLQQQERILCQGTTTSTTSTSQSSTLVTSNATATPIATETPTSAPMATPTATSGATLTASAPTAKVTEHSSRGEQTPQAAGGVGQVPIVKNLSGTLANCILCQEFRDYLVLLDSKIPKPKFQVKLAKLIYASLDDAMLTGLVGPGASVP